MNEYYTITIVKTFADQESNTAGTINVLSATVEQCDPMAIMKAIHQKPRKRAKKGEGK